MGVWIGGRWRRSGRGGKTTIRIYFMEKIFFSIKEVKYHKKNQILKILNPRTKRGDSWVSILYSETVHICKF